MRALLLAAGLVALVPANAFAGSITSLAPDAGHGESITALACQACTVPVPTPRPTHVASTEEAPVTETVRIVRKDGNVNVYRTDAWMGGDPVTTVSVADEADLAALKRRGIDVASSKPQTPRHEIRFATGDLKGPVGLDRIETGSLEKADTAATFDPQAMKLRPAH
ncbi:plant virulence effector HPE1-like domain-containing protein [Pararhizobium mangrovi]|uniref:Uncharacterized protein n=1 Tax=Pararhizobium mangrovi TaxID=2590452 RepID=A0A506TY18_9HYPH|nr:plant virulence effector HPE1-like domain-containing protein [Pararhizobium mangrovi]TPW26206.1 hypothetical protein FJU11_15585 [Pararhizobium mangrovi]